MGRLPIILGLVVVAVVVLLSSVFIVDERKQALVLQFGQVKQVRTEPGVGFKLPLIQDVVFYEGRILPLDTQPLEVTPLDERRLVVDAFARWRITDPVQFRQAVQTEAAGAQRLESILNASLREVLGSVPSEDVLSPERTVLMGRIRDEARREAENLGVEIVDVRIRRADLPEQNLNATFERMNAEREREAADERARGKERAQEIRATADRQAVELTSDAQRQAAIIRGQADAERNKIYADAYGRDPEFFAFYRSLSAYESALQGSNSTLVISPDSEFFDYLKSDRAIGQRTDRTEAPRAALLPPADGAGNGAAPAPQAGGAGTPIDPAAQDATVIEPISPIGDQSAIGGPQAGETSAAQSSGVQSSVGPDATVIEPADSLRAPGADSGAATGTGTDSDTGAATDTATDTGAASDAASDTGASTASSAASTTATDTGSRVTGGGATTTTVIAPGALGSDAGAGTDTGTAPDADADAGAAPTPLR